MDVDELIAEHEARRSSRRYVPVDRIPRWPRRHVRLEQMCTCHACVSSYQLESANASHETGEAMP